MWPFVYPESEIFLSDPALSHPHSEPPSRILIVRLSAHGDTLQTLPVLAALKMAFPQSEIGWLVGEEAAPLLTNHPSIHHLHVCPLTRWKRQLKSSPAAWGGVLKEIRAFVAELKAQHYTVSLDIQGLLKSAIWPALANIPHRVGRKPGREQSHWFYTDCLPAEARFDPNRPAAEWFLDLVRYWVQKTGGTAEAVSALSLNRLYPMPTLLPEEAERLADKLACLAKANKPIIAIAPTTIWPTKHWLPEYWVTLITGIIQQQKATCILVGAPKDEAYITPIEQAVRAKLTSDVASGKESRLMNWVGQTTLRDFYTLFPQVDAFVGLDSALLHLASVVASNHPEGNPHIMGLFGPTAPGRTGPYGTQHTTLQTKLPCQPCFQKRCAIQTHDCMKQLLPEHVLTMLQQPLITQ